jgi:hypothetical protein
MSQSLMTDKRAGMIGLACLWLVLATAVSLVISRSWWLQWQAAQRYEPVPAFVLTSEIRRDTHRNPVRFVPVIAYRYTHAGTDRVSDRRFWYGIDEGWDEDSANRALVPYPVNARVTAYVDPQRPEYVVLDGREPAWRHLTLPAMLVLSGVIAVGLALRRPARATLASGGASETT